jgi:ABC-2 type transport system ATP-binding protein
MSSITLQSLTKTYGNVRALDGLDLEVEEGSVFGFLGPNGAGKTTTMRILAGLARPTSGKVTIAGMTLSNNGATPKALIGYLPEEPAFYPWMSPTEYLNFVGRIFGLNTTERKARTALLLKQSGLKEVANRHIGGFSRGMRQRLGIAQALVNRPRILLLDEPVSALDPAGRKEVLEMIETLGSECTVVMSSHILADVERVCDTVAIIDHGRLVTQDKKVALLERYAIPALELTVNNGQSAQMPTWQKRLETLPNVTGVSASGYTFHVAVKRVEDAQREILQDALDHQVHFDKLEVVKPSLEDIFMQLVGGQK